MGYQDCQLKLETIELDTFEVELDTIPTFPRELQLELDAQLAAESLPNSLNSPAVQVDDAKINIAIDIDLQKVEEDLVTRMIPCSNDAEIDDAAYIAVVQWRKIRPKR